MSKSNKITNTTHKMATAAAVLAVLLDRATAEHVLGSGTTTVTTTTTTTPASPTVSFPQTSVPSSVNTQPYNNVRVNPYPTPTTSTSSDWST